MKYLIEYKHEIKQAFCDMKSFGTFGVPPVARLPTAVNLVLGWIFDGYSVQFQPRLPGDLPDNSSRRTVSAPRGESLETDLGTVNKLLHVNISIQNTCGIFNSFHAM